MDLTEAHYSVLWFAVDGADPSAPAGGVWAWVGGEQVWQIAPLDPESARTAALDLLDAGAVEVLRERRRLSDDEARALFADPVYPERAERGFHELTVTWAGETLWTEAKERFGDEYERVQRLHEEEFAAFLARHPEFQERRQAWLDDQMEWVKHGGRQPKFPWDEYPDWPYPHG